MYEKIVNIRPYFLSLREIGDNVWLDIKFPISWKYDLFLNEQQYILQDRNNELVLLSILNESTEEGYLNCFEKAKEIIDFNKEAEEKEKLLAETMVFLKKMFETQPLGKLKNILNHEKIKEEYNGTNIDEGN